MQEMVYGGYWKKESRYFWTLESLAHVGETQLKTEKEEEVK